MVKVSLPEQLRNMILAGLVSDVQGHIGCMGEQESMAECLLRIDVDVVSGRLSVNHPA